MQRNDVIFKKGNAAYYTESTRILRYSKTLKVIAKTPTLFITSQRKKSYQMKYYKELLRSLKKEIRIKYLFSLPLTYKELLTENKKISFNDIDAWNIFSKHPKIDLRFIEYRNAFSCVIGDNEAAVLLTFQNGQRGCIVIRNSYVPFYAQTFEEMFRTASKQHKSAINTIFRALNNSHISKS